MDPEEAIGLLIFGSLASFAVYMVYAVTSYW
jgi:hypothetical protein